MPSEKDLTKLPAQESIMENKTTWSRYYGLPSWMRVPIDRLNIKTDFEEYACSPPEVESGFVPEFESKVNPEPAPTLKTSRSAPMLSEKPLTVVTQRQISSDFVKEVALRESLKLVKPGALPQQLNLAIPASLNSNSATPSAENTPNSTPQGSPYITRKANRGVGGLPLDESPCGNNTKKWFYTGLFANEKALEVNKTASLPLALNDESASKKQAASAKCPLTQETKNGKEEKRARKISLPSPGYKKFTVSNFDLNAVSPTSW